MLKYDIAGESRGTQGLLWYQKMSGRLVVAWIAEEMQQSTIYDVRDEVFGNHDVIYDGEVDQGARRQQLMTK